MIFVARIKIDNNLSRRPEGKLPPILKGELIGLVDEEDVPLPAPDLLGLVYGYELDEVPPQDVGGFALVVLVHVVAILPLEDGEEVPHRRRPERGERLACDGNDCPAVLVGVTQLNQSRQDGERLAGPGAALVYLHPGVAALDMVVGGGLFQLTSAFSAVNHESGFFSATAISCRSTYPRPLPLVFRKKMVAAGLPSRMSLCR